MTAERKPPEDKRKPGQLLYGDEQKLIQILRYQFHRYWTHCGENYDPSTIELFEVAPAVFVIWLLQQEEGSLWPDCEIEQQRVLPGVERHHRKDFETLLQSPSLQAQIISLVTQAWGLIAGTAAASSAGKFRVLESSTIVQLKICQEGDPTPRLISLYCQSSEEEFGVRLREPELLHLWQLATRHCSRVLLQEQVEGLFALAKKVPSPE